MPTVRCPMPECRRRVSLDDFEAIPIPPAQPPTYPCLHFIAAWGGLRGPMVESILHGLTGNREFLVRNLRPHEVTRDRIDLLRRILEAVARQAGHVLVLDPAGTGDSSEQDDEIEGVLFADRHEANQIAREFAHHILGAGPIPSGGSL